MADPGDDFQMVEEVEDDQTLDLVLTRKLDTLKVLPESVHLFCPRQGDEEDNTPYEFLEESLNAPEGFGEGNRPTADVVILLNEGMARREMAADCLMIFAYNQVEYKSFMEKRMNQLFRSCNHCILGYYKEKKKLLERIAEDYPEDQVLQFAGELGQVEINRLSAGLGEVTRKLKDMPPPKRRLGALDREQIMTIAESLCCETLLKDENLLREHFDEAFKMVQGKKGLGIVQFVPATTRFLFEPNQDRFYWAWQIWQKFEVSPSKEEFEWTMREPLLEILNKVSWNFQSGQPIDQDLLLRLWRGLSIMLNNLNNDRITHSLRALNPNPLALLLDHLAHARGETFRVMLRVCNTLLEKCPEIFWEDMPTHGSAKTVVEQICNNKQFEQFLREARESHDYETSVLKDMLAWIEPFVKSQKCANQPDACRALGPQLLDRFQQGRFPDLSRSHCYRIGIAILQIMVESFEHSKPSEQSVARGILQGLQDVVATHADILLSPPTHSLDSQSDPYSLVPRIRVLSKSLELDCQCLRADFRILKGGQPMDHPNFACTSKVWPKAVTHLKNDNTELAKGVLVALIPLVGLERLRGKRDFGRGGVQFNDAFDRAMKFESQIFERLADYRAESLDVLISASNTGTSIISALFSASEDVSQAAVELIKNVSGQSGRKEAIRHIFEAFFGTAAEAFIFPYRRIAATGTFSSTPSMIKIGNDVVDALCDPQSGIMRTRLLAGQREVNAIKGLWSNLWGAVTVIFNSMEQWSTEGTGIHKAALMDFCRDNMQFAELLFGYYDVFASAMRNIKLDSAQQKLEDSPESLLLVQPAQALEYITRWMRFRDEYLASVSVKLVLMMLRRLGELGLSVSDKAIDCIEGMSTVPRGSVGHIKTNLTEQQKVELARASDIYLGKTPRNTQLAEKKAPQKQGTLTDWTKSAPKPGESNRKVIVDVDDFDDSGILDDDLLELTLPVDQLKARKAAQNRQTPSEARLAISKSIKLAKKSDVDVLTFREKREREKEEKKRRDAQEIARQKKNQIVPDSTSDQSDAGAKRKRKGGEESMMVSSSSDSEDPDAGVFGAKIRRQDKTSKHDPLLNQLLVKQGPVRKVRQIRSAKDMRARLTPDLSALHKVILSWDFFSESDVPPSSNQRDYSLVSSEFKTPVDYQKTFEPLLILEAWQGFRKDREEGTFKPFPLKISNRLTVDAFVEVSTSMSMKDGQEFFFGEADVVLLSKSETPATDQSQLHCLARVSRVIRKKGLVEISYRVSPKSHLLTSLNPGTDIWGVKISSLTPLEREYGALLALQYYDLCDEIIRAKPSPILDYTDKTLAPLVNNYQINQAQAKAVKSALDNDAFTLIQGPPGSGKTKTIVALVGALLTPSLVNQGVTIIRPSGANGNNTTPSTSKKLLVCAPSNAAVDELVMRLKDGVKTLNGRDENLSVVRIGRSDAINANVKDVTLEELVQAKLSRTTPKDSKEKDIHELMMEHKKTSDELRAVRAQNDELRSKGGIADEQLDREFEILKRKKNQLSAAIDSAREKGNTAARDSELNRRKIQQEILDGAHVICATLSGSGHDMFQNLSIEFETVIIDEAAQSIELSALIPLKYGCSKCILVGDPKQLPPTVLSRAAAKFQYEQSLFVRMQSNHPNDVHLLDTQYRMHPEISKFPSKAFYESKLRDGAGMATLRGRPWHQSEIFAPYRFFDVQGVQQAAPKGHSLINVAEVNVAVQLYSRLLADCKGYDFGGKIGIITPYKSQLKELKSRFAFEFGEDILTRVEFNTTDAFQGRESEVIIFSCVRASTAGIGFLADVRRMNVGLTRAKCSLWVLGNSQSLIRGEFWGALVRDSRDRGLFTEGDILGLLSKRVLVIDAEMTDVSGSFSASAALTTKPAAKSNSASIISGPTSFRDPPGRSSLMSNRSDTISATTHSTSDRSLSDRPKAPSVRAKMRLEDNKTTSSVEKSRPSKPSEDISRRVPDKLRDTLTRRAGGHNGMNDLQNCSICGSSDHYNYACDNMDAKVAAYGSCARCKDQNHPTSECTAERCLDCGDFGHEAKTCSNMVTLSKWEKSRLRRSESFFTENRKRKPSKARQRQLEEHDPKVPFVRPTRDDYSSTTGPSYSKRKREESRTFSDCNKVPRAEETTASFQRTASVGGESRAMNKPEGLSNGNDEQKGPGNRASAPTRPSIPTGQSRAMVRPPGLKKRKEAQLFIQPKRKPKPS